MPIADLEISLRRADAYNHSVDLRFRRPDSDAIIPPRHGEAQFDLSAYDRLANDTEAYGRQLTADLFENAAIREGYKEARRIAELKAFVLRMRLFIAPTAQGLHRLRWETLFDPETGARLVTNENTLFSRYMSSYDWRPIHLRARGQIRALAAVAGPSNLAQYNLPPVDVPGELERLRTSLGNIQITELGGTERASLKNISSELRRGYDILYVVCHGLLAREGPRILLEDDDGTVDSVTGKSFVERLSELQARPNLVVLVSCQSAGSTRDRGVLSAIGPRLSEAGVPAVLAMQGDVTMESMKEFMPTFFQELQRDGLIDGAMATARGKIRERGDWWTPTLFMRLESGKIWATPGFGDQFERWSTLLSNIFNERCTAILGSGLLDPLVGSSREIAQHWAEAHRFPMSPYDREDLPQVAQYLSVVQEDVFLRDEFVNELSKELKHRHQATLPDELKSRDVERLNAEINRIGAERRRAVDAEAHKVLAHLPIPRYITTNPDEQLVDALKEAGKEPQVDLCRWKLKLRDNTGREIKWPGPGVDSLPDYEPTPANPLVYHVFGWLKHLDSLVLTEDDFFDYLITVSGSGKQNPTPLAVRSALNTTHLLFLGFYIDDWDFRIFFRSLMRQQGKDLGKNLHHVAAQIDPEEGRILDPSRARRFLQQYFGNAKIDIYWGSTDDFIQELKHNWNSRYPSRQIP